MATRSETLSVSSDASAPGAQPALAPAQALKELYRRKAAAFSRRPGFARSSGQARAYLAGGFVCRVEHEDRSQDVDQPTSEGGTATAPHPGQLMRASLAACLAMGYRMWGARLDVAIDEVSVEVTCEYDARGQLGLDPEVAVGWQRVRFDVVIASDAPDADVRRVVETADRLSPMLANLSPAIDRSFRLKIESPSTARDVRRSAAALPRGHEGGA